jgi:hypothetical protein
MRFVNMMDVVKAGGKLDQQGGVKPDQRKC